jgi:flagellar basal-body rod protein FlgC
MVYNSPLLKALRTAASGANVQNQRLKVIAENIAGSQITPTKPGESPYARKVISFKTQFDKKQGVHKAAVKVISKDKTPFPEEYDPTHPAADENGMVKMPNVNWQAEVRDYHEAMRSHQVNLNLIQVTRRMIEEHIRIIGR